MRGLSISPLAFALAGSLAIPAVAHANERPIALPVPPVGPRLYTSDLPPEPSTVRSTDGDYWARGEMRLETPRRFRWRREPYHYGWGWRRWGR